MARPARQRVGCRDRVAPGELAVRRPRQRDRVAAVGRGVEDRHGLRELGRVGHRPDDLPGPGRRVGHQHQGDEHERSGEQPAQVGVAAPEGGLGPRRRAAGRGDDEDDVRQQPLLPVAQQPGAGYVGDGPAERVRPSREVGEAGEDEADRGRQGQGRLAPGHLEAAERRARRGRGPSAGGPARTSASPGPGTGSTPRPCRAA